MIRIGANPVIWTNDDLPEIGADTPLEQCLTEARSVGVEGMELGNKFPRQAGALRPILAKHQLDLVAGWYSTYLLDRSPEAELAAARPHIDLLKAFGCRVFIAAECARSVHGNRRAPLSTRPVLSNSEWPLFAQRLGTFATLLDREGLTLAYHHHMGTVIETGDEIDRLMAQTNPPVSLLLDTGHAAWAGDDPVRLARRYRDRIVHIHAKDLRTDVATRARSEDLSFLDAVLEGVYTVPGDGEIDFAAVFRELPGYRGWIVLEAEQDPTKADPLTYARMGLHNLRGFLQQAGRG